MSLADYDPIVQLKKKKCPFFTVTSLKIRRSAS